MKTPVTKETLRNHLAYCWWKYALLIILAVFGWNIVYTTTRYRAPDDKRVTMNVYVYADSEGLTAYMNNVHETQMSDMEEMSVIYNVPDATYGEVIFSTHVAVREGNVYVVSRDYFQRYAASEAFKPLEEETELVAMLEEAGISLSQGWRTVTETGERHLFGIPCAHLPGIARYIGDPEDTYLCVLIGNLNDENAQKFLNIFVSDMLKEPVPTEAPQP